MRLGPSAGCLIEQANVGEVGQHFYPPRGKFKQIKLPVPPSVDYACAMFIPECPALRPCSPQAFTGQPNAEKAAYTDT
jgi:hypothetical protein